MPKIIIQRLQNTPVFALVGHLFCSGKSGSGKSNACEYICTNILEQGKHKVVDLYDSGRFENMLYSFAETDPYLNKKLWNITQKKPKGFKTQVIAIPGSELRYIDKLPKNINLMSFNIEDLDINDLYYLLGMSDKLEGFLASLSNTYGDDLNMKQIYEIVNTGMLDGKRSPVNIPGQIKGMVIRNIRRWLTSGMFSDELPKINFEDILSDTKTITSFSTFLLGSEEAERVAYGLILKKINDCKRRRKVKNRVWVYCREISVFFQENWGMSKKYILEYLRQGRDRGINIIADGQRIFDIPSKYRRQFGIIIQLKTDFADAEKLKDFQGDIPYKFLKKAPTWGVGEGIMVSGTSWEYPTLFPPTRHKHKNPKFHVMELMGKTYGWNVIDEEYVESIMSYDFSKEEEVEEKETTSHIQGEEQPTYEYTPQKRNIKGRKQSK